MNIKKKFLLQAAILAVVPAMLTGVVVTWQANQSSMAVLENKANEQLSSLTQLKKTQITEHLNSINTQVLNLARDLTVIAASEDFIDTFHQPIVPEQLAVSRQQVAHYYTQWYETELAKYSPHHQADGQNIYASLDDQAMHYQYKYIAANANDLGSKDNLVQAGDDPYDHAHARYHPFFRDFLNSFGYYDIFIVDPNDGRIVYSVFKEVDYGTSLLTGPFADSGLAQAFTQALSLKDSDQSVLVDYAPYRPSYDQVASFIASPIMNAKEQVSGILIFQMPMDGINHIMTNDGRWEEVGLGDSGEVILVGPDQLLRSESRMLLQDPTQYFATMLQYQQPNLDKIRLNHSALGAQRVDSVGLKEALQGKQGIEKYLDHRGVEVLSAYASVEFGTSRWAIVSTMDSEEIFAASHQLSQDMYFWMLVSISTIGILSLVIGSYCANQLTSPINTLVARLKDISSGEGDLTAKLELASRDDEIGEVGRAFNQFVAKIKDIIISIDTHATQLSASAEELSSVSRQTNRIVELQKYKTNEVTALITEFSQSFKDIAHNSVDTEALTDDASGESAKGARLSNYTLDAINGLVASVDQAAFQLQQLNSKVSDISDILGVINGIADQTNLLALNAAIEAARAGEFGRGFAVVADEVRSLAVKTQSSTVEIQTKIADLVSSTNKSVEIMELAVTEANKGGELVKNTASSLNLVADLVATVSSKSSRSTQVAKAQSMSVEDVHRNISDIAAHSESTACATLQTTQASEELARLTASMSGIVQQFKY